MHEYLSLRKISIYYPVLGTLRTNFGPSSQGIATAPMHENARRRLG
jgi:hypothetical protein